MEPTTIKTKTTKPLRDLTPKDGQAEIIIGGTEHFIERPSRGDYWEVCATKTKEVVFVGDHAFDPDAQVTVTEERQMTVEDLGAEDCYRMSSMDDRVAFAIKFGRDRRLRVDRNGAVSQVRKTNHPKPVTLVTPIFDAEPAQESETVPVEDAESKFLFRGKYGHRERNRGTDFTLVRWHGAELSANLPSDTPVTVHTDVTYDSWDDVSVGDVFIREGGVACIKLSKNEWYEGGAGGGVRQANRRPIIGREFGQSVKPARLTSVSWERIPEVER
jgi:hypothetical protein